MNGTNNPVMLLTSGFVGGTAFVGGTTCLWFLDGTGVLTSGLAYNANNTIWLNLDLSIAQQVTWTAA